MAQLKLLCPKCGSGKLVVRGHSEGQNREVQKQRWNCRSNTCPTKGGWHGTRPVNIELYEQFPERFDDKAAPALPPKQVKARIRELNAYKKDSDVASFIITAAQNATPPHAPFLENLMVLAEQFDAQPIVIPFRYHNPTSHWGQKARTDDWWHADLVPFCVNHRFSLNRKIDVLADIKTQPTATDPLSRMESMTGPKWGVVGHTKLRLKCIPTAPGKEPKVMVSTGAVTLPNYTPTKAGKQGEFHHVFGATLVQVRGIRTYIYQIVADNDGSFIHRDKLYKGGEVFEAPRPLALVLGDSHVDFMDSGVTNATFGEKGIVPELRPEYLVWHDLNDFYAGSHHHDRPEMFFTRLAKSHAGRADIKAELTRAFAYVNEHSPEYCHNVFPYSNHGNEHLWKWLNSKDPREDYVNFGFWLDTWQQLYRNMTFGSAGAETVDPFAFWGQKMLDEPENATFLGPNDSMELKQVDVGAHGHLGPNGSRGTVKNLARTAQKSMTGHGHAPEIFEGHTRVGKSAGAMEYEKGPGSGMHAHGILYANGKRCLLFIDGGEWEL